MLCCQPIARYNAIQGLAIMTVLDLRVYIVPIDRSDYKFTQHLRERFLQRTNKKFLHLQTCKSDFCRTCEKMKKEIHTEIAFDRKTIDQELSRRINLADEDRSYLNNSQFMSWYYEKYGYEKRFQFLIHEDITFVAVHEETEKVIVTCVFSKRHISGKSFLAKKRFKKPCNNCD